MAPTDLGDWYDYFIPETWNPADLTGVLKNKLGATTQEELTALEGNAVLDRQRELQDDPGLVTRTFDAEHVKAIHAHLFQDVYPWAGQYRTVDIEKNGLPFAAHEHELGAALNRATDRVATTDWPNMDRRGFIENISAVFADLNFAHPFREGNGRTTREFLAHVAEQSSYSLDFGQISREGSPISREVWNQRSMFSGPDKGSALTHPEEMHSIFAELIKVRPKAK